MVDLERFPLAAAVEPGLATALLGCVGFDDPRQQPWVYFKYDAECHPQYAVLLGLYFILAELERAELL
jgi:hypothetical protein